MTDHLVGVIGIAEIPAFLLNKPPKSFLAALGVEAFRNKAFMLSEASIAGIEGIDEDKFCCLYCC
jgi:hypothetical protein